MVASVYSCIKVYFLKGYKFTKRGKGTLRKKYIDLTTIRELMSSFLKIPIIYSVEKWWERRHKIQCTCSVLQCEFSPAYLCEGFNISLSWVLIFLKNTNVAKIHQCHFAVLHFFVIHFANMDFSYFCKAWNFSPLPIFFNTAFLT